MFPFGSVTRRNAVPHEGPGDILPGEIAAEIVRGSGYMLDVLLMHDIDKAGSYNILLPRLAVGSELFGVEGHEPALLDGLLASTNEIVAPEAVLMRVVGDIFAARSQCQRSSCSTPFPSAREDEDGGCNAQHHCQACEVRHCRNQL